MLDFDYLENLIQPLLNKNKKLSSKKIAKFSNIIDELNSIQELSRFKTIREKFIAIENKWNDLPKCVCGNDLVFKSRNFPTYCKKCPESKKLIFDKIKAINIERFGVEYPLQSKEIRDKAKQTNLDKYGVENPFERVDIKDKIKESNLEKYGVENLFESKDIRNKARQTNIDRYGVVSPIQNQAIKDKIRHTNIEKYGVDNPSKVKSIRDRQRNTMAERYGVEYSAQNKEIYDKVIKTNLEKYGVKTPLQLQKVKDFAIDKRRESNKEILLPLKLEKLKEVNIFPNKWGLEDYQGIHTDYQFIHQDCNEVFAGNFRSGRFPQCPTCHLFANVSQIELKFRNDLIETLGRDRVNYSDRETIKPKELDIVIDNKLAIEVNGSYWHSENVAKYPILHKSEISPITVMHFWDFELENKYEVCKSMVLSKLGIYKDKIFARQCEIREVDSKTAQLFLDNNHLQGFVGSSIKIGLYFNDQLVQIITLGKPRFNKNYNLELHRLCSKLNTVVIGGTERLLKYVRNNYNASILTYSDKRYSNGDVYRRLGFKELKDSLPNYYWVNGGIILSRYQTQKHKLLKLLGENKFKEGLSENENMQLNNYHKIYDCGNKVFALV